MKKVIELTELAKYQMVNRAQTAEELSQAILACSHPITGEIVGKTRSFDGEKMAENCINVIKNRAGFNTLTRNYGIRQQALYLALSS